MHICRSYRYNGSGLFARKSSIGIFDVEPRINKACFIERAGERKSQRASRFYHFCFSNPIPGLCEKRHLRAYKRSPPPSHGENCRFDRSIIPRVAMKEDRSSFSHLHMHPERFYSWQIRICTAAN